MKQEFNNEKLEGIIRKVKGLLALAEDNSNEDEAQSAFVMAQKLMIKYNIELSEVKTNETPSIVKGQATAYKTLYWHEKVLANIISKNFRVKYYYNSKRNAGERIKRTVMFFGLETDVKIAQEMYVLALDALEFYAKKYVDSYYEERFGLHRTKGITTEVKNSYMKGFLAGLSDKLDQQRNELQQEFGLMVLTPQAVIDEYKEFEKGFGKPLALRTPNTSVSEAYGKGYKDGNEIDYTKSTINV